MNSLEDKLKHLKDFNKTLVSLENEIYQTLSQNQKLTDLKNELEEKIRKLNLENEELLASKDELKNILNERNEEIVAVKNDSEQIYFANSDNSFSLGINNLLVRNKEAIHDALSHFDKKCPYCKEDLFQTTNRKQFEIDHFFPVVKGGQDLPWNLLPVCQNCNRKKRDTLPNNFLDNTTYKEVSNYLEKVHQKFLEESIDSYTFKEKLSELIEKEHLFIKRNIRSDFITNLLYLADKHHILREELSTIEPQNEIDQTTALIVEFLNKEIPESWIELDIVERRNFLNNRDIELEGNSNLHQRKFVCVAEIWCECLGNKKEDMDRYKTREINSIMKSLPNWAQRKTTKNFPIYGIQKFYERENTKPKIG